MVADTSGRGSRLFPEIRVQFGSLQTSLVPGVQIVALSALIAVAAALCYCSVNWVGRDRLLAEREAAVVRAESANIDLQHEVASLRDRLAIALRARDQAEARSTASASEPQQPPAPGEATRPTVVQLAQALEQSQRELRQVEAQRATLAARLSKAESERAEATAGRSPYRARLETATKKLQQVTADRDKALSERDRLRARIAELEQKHSQREMSRPRGLGGALRLAGLITTELVQSETELVQSEADSPRPEAVITDAPPELEQNKPSVAGIGWRAVSEFRRVLASTGLNIERLFPQFGSDRAEGGPFVPPPKGDQPSGISREGLEAMRSLLKSLPLTVPLDHYQLESRFGPRRDPFNRRPSFHTGIDLSAPYMSAVYATAAGIVSYAGYRSEYGKVVEIDHGNGITTLYGHLHRYTVSVGQPVAEHAQIGLLGSTGRSSGPHVHYEILVNDEPQDPEKFIGLSRLIPVAGSERAGGLP